MAEFILYRDTDTDSTVVSNRFIDNYLRDANDAQVKVYLYLLRMSGAALALSISTIADKFNHTEKDILRALRYWEKLGLLSLDFHKDKNLQGIRLHAISDPTESDIVAQSSEEPMKTTLFTSDTDRFSKPIPASPRQNGLKDRQATEQLLFIAETYLGRTLSSTDVQTIYYCKDVLHFSDDLIDYLLQYCVGKQKKDFRYIEKVALGWAQAGITTPKQAKDYSLRYDQRVYPIMSALGKSSTPTDKEVAFIDRWTGEYAFSLDVILEACERTVMATDKHRFEYAESILAKWKSKDVHNKADVLRIDDLYRQRDKSSSPKASVTGKTNQFNQFTQRSYDFDKLEKELLSN
ncbi:MAG: DnaD domain protein [Clostridium sp.]|jgi:DnaD/phage-associated family protein|nr:DnaD domain protein [Clostridium sp.]